MRHGVRHPMTTWRDRGSATVAVIAALAVLGLVGAAVVTGSAVADASARAQGAADLAALAAAERARDDRALGRIGYAAPCELASTVVAANGAALAECTVSARGVVHVRVSATLGSGPGAVTVMRAAVAGPAGAAS